MSYLLCEVCHTAFRVRGTRVTCPSCGAVYAKTKGGSHSSSPEVIHLESSAERTFEVLVIEHATTTEIIDMPDRVSPGETFDVHVHVHCNVDCYRAHAEEFLLNKKITALIVKTGVTFEGTLTRSFDESVGWCPARPWPHWDHGGVEGWISVTAPDVAGIYTLRVTFPRQSPKGRATISIPIIVG